MRRPRFVDASIFILKYIFNWRFWIAGLTKKSKAIKKIIDKMLFEDDEIIVVPNTIKINKKIFLFIGVFILERAVTMDGQL